MKCRLTEKKNMTVMLIIGIILAVGGAIAAYLLPEEQHMLTRVAGMATGAGTSLAVMAAAVLIRRAVIGEERARDSELAMNDERGLTVAYKAQNAAAIAAVLGVVLLVIVAVLRGDGLYMQLGCAICIAIALIKLVAYSIYNRRM